MSASEGVVKWVNYKRMGWLWAGRALLAGGSLVAEERLRLHFKGGSCQKE